MEAFGLLGVLSMWGTLGATPWFAALIASRGRTPLLGLPLAIAMGVGAGALVPALGAKDFLGFWLSLSTAVVGGAAVSMGMVRMLHADEHRPR